MTRCQLSLLTGALLLPWSVLAHGSLLTDKPVSQLLREKSSEIAALKVEASKLGADLSLEPYSNDVFFLRYCLDDVKVPIDTTIQWRLGEGKPVWAAALQGTRGKQQSWNSTLQATPTASSVISKYIDPSNCMTTVTSKGDLVYCIRAGMIEDQALMQDLNTVDPMVQFFLYIKEVNMVEANRLSLKTNRLVSVITANDLTGIQLMGGDSRFRSALTQSSQKASTLYPNLSGPTLLLNLPRFLGAVSKLFTPFIPPSVKQKLRFENGPLSKVKTLVDISNDGNERDQFLQQLDKLVYN